MPPPPALDARTLLTPGLLRRLLRRIEHRPTLRRTSINYGIALLSDRVQAMRVHGGTAPRRLRGHCMDAGTTAARGSRGRAIYRLCALRGAHASLAPPNRSVAVENDACQAETKYRGLGA